MSARDYDHWTKHDVVTMLENGYTQQEVYTIKDVPPRTQRRWKRAAETKEHGGSPPGEDPRLNGYVNTDKLVENLKDHPELASVEGQRAMVRYAMSVILQSAMVGTLSGELPLTEVRKLMDTMTKWHDEVESGRDDEMSEEEFQPIFEEVLESARIAELEEADFQTPADRRNKREYEQNLPGSGSDDDVE